MNFGEITLSHYLALSSLLFLIGLAGVILRRSLLIIMMSLELLLNAANLALVAVGRFQGLPDPQVAVFFCHHGCCGGGFSRTGDLGSHFPNS